MTNINVDKIKSADIFDYVSDDVLEEINCVFDDTNIAYYLEDFFKNKTTYLDIFKGISETYIRYIMKEKNSVKVTTKDIRKYIQWCNDKYNELISYTPGKYDLPIPGNSKPSTFYNIDVNYDTSIDIFTYHINRHKFPELLISTLGYTKREFVAYLQDAYRRYTDYVIFKSNNLGEISDKRNEIHPCVLQFHCFEVYYKDWFDEEYKSLVDNKDEIIDKLKEIRSEVTTNFNINSAEIFDEIMKNMKQYNIMEYLFDEHSIDNNSGLIKLYGDSYIKKYIKYLRTKLNKEDITVDDVRKNTDYFKDLYIKLTSYKRDQKSDYILDTYKRFIQFNNINDNDKNIRKSIPVNLYLIAYNFARHGVLKSIYDNNKYKSHKDYLKTVTSLMLDALDYYKDYIESSENKIDFDNEEDKVLGIIIYGDEVFKTLYQKFDNNNTIEYKSSEKHENTVNKILNKIDEISQTQYNISDEIFNSINSKLIESGIADYIKDNYSELDLTNDKINSIIHRYIDYITENENTSTITSDLVNKYDDWFAKELLSLNSYSHKTIRKYESYRSLVSHDEDNINSIKCERAIHDCISRSGIATELEKYIAMNKLSSDIWVSTIDNLVKDYTSFCTKKKYPNIKYDKSLKINPSDIFYYANEYFPQKYKEVVEICSTAK